MRLFLLAAALVLAACQSGPKQPLVGVVPKGASHQFWLTVHAGALKAAEEYGLQVEWNAPATETDASRQIQIVESMVNRRVAGIVLAPVDAKALSRVVERAAEAGIPVAIFDSGIDTQRRLTYVATDNREGGRMAARRLGELLGGKGKVAVIGFKPGSASTMEREEGFADEIRAKFPQMQVVGMEYTASDRALARAKTENFLTAHPDLAGVFADNESASVGAVLALKGRDAKQVKMVGFDASDQLLAELASGWIDSLVVQNPWEMGYQSTKAIGMKLRGEQVAAQMDSGATLVTKDNYRQPQVQSLLHPPIERYLKH